MSDFITGAAMLAVGLSFLYGMLSRGKSLVTAKMLGISVPIRLIQLALSLFIIGGGLYLLLR